MLQKEITDWTFKVYLLTGEPSQFLILADLIIGNDLCQILSVVLEFFFQTERDRIFFRGLTYCPNSVKWLWPLQIGKNKNRINFDLPKVIKMTINFEMLKAANWPVWKSIYLQSWRRWKYHIWTAGKPHSKGFVGYPNNYFCKKSLLIDVWFGSIFWFGSPCEMATK